MQDINYKVRTYSKISRSKKEQLLNLVYRDELKINQAAHLLNINYATAKYIILKFKKSRILQNSVKIPESKRCHYKIIDESKHQRNSVNTRGGLIGDCLMKQEQKI